MRRTQELEQKRKDALNALALDHAGEVGKLELEREELNKKISEPTEERDTGNHNPAESQVAIADKAKLLTRRQREILQLFAEGRSAKEVAAVLHISVRTAESHKARIMTLLGAATTSDLVLCAIRHGLIAPT